MAAMVPQQVRRVRGQLLYDLRGGVLAEGALAVAGQARVKADDQRGWRQGAGGGRGQ